MSTNPKKRLQRPSYTYSGSQLVNLTSGGSINTTGGSTNIVTTG